MPAVVVAHTGRTGGAAGATGTATTARAEDRTGEETTEGAEAAEAIATAKEEEEAAEIHTTKVVAEGGVDVADGAAEEEDIRGVGKEGKANNGVETGGTAIRPMTLHYSHKTTRCLSKPRSWFESSRTLQKKALWLA
mmetsp:Transcript_13685/g.20131  ORF Transcript_13685/g.20131 Transcript_13685/m.20131 type:complete len:137 (+) Transcript_13685:2834-3244(+)